MMLTSVAPVFAAMAPAASIMSRVSFSVMRPPSLGTICSRAPEDAHVVELLAGEGVGGDDVQRIALHRADERQRHAGAAAGVFDDRAAGGSRPSASAASIMASAIRSFMLPVGFSLSSFSRMRAPFAGTMWRNGSSEVLPMRSRIIVACSAMPHPPAFGGNAARAPKRGGVGAQTAAALARAFQQ